MYCTSNYDLWNSKCDLTLTKLVLIEKSIRQIDKATKSGCHPHLSMKLQFSQKYTGTSKLELSSITPLHLGHLISGPRSVTIDSFCSVRLQCSRLSVSD